MRAPHDKKKQPELSVVSFNHVSGLRVVSFASVEGLVEASHTLSSANMVVIYKTETTRPSVYSSVRRA